MGANFHGLQPDLSIHIIWKITKSTLHNDTYFGFPDLSVGTASSSDFSEKNDDLIDLIYCA